MAFANYTTLISLKPIIPDGFVQATEMSSGHIKLRKKHTKMRRQYEVVLLMTRWEMVDFLAWYDNDPTQKFQHYNYINGQVKDYRVIPGTIQIEDFTKQNSMYRVTMMWSEV